MKRCLEEVSDTGTWSDEDVGRVVSNKSEHLDCTGIVSNVEMSLLNIFEFEAACAKTTGFFSLAKLNQFGLA